MSDTIPTTSPPTMAPKVVPRPPSTTAAKVTSSTRWPMFHDVESELASMIPDNPASAPATTHTIRMTRWSSMPDATDRSRLSDTARMAVPSRARCRNRPMAIRQANATAVITRSLGRSDTGPSDTVGDCAAYWAYCWGDWPNTMLNR